MGTVGVRELVDETDMEAEAVPMAPVKLSRMMPKKALIRASSSRMAVAIKGKMASRARM